MDSLILPPAEEIARLKERVNVQDEKINELVAIINEVGRAIIGHEDAINQLGALVLRMRRGDNGQGESSDGLDEVEGGTE